MGMADEHFGTTEQLVQELQALNRNLVRCTEAIVRAIEAQTADAHGGGLWDKTQDMFAEAYHLLD